MGNPKPKPKSKCKSQLELHVGDENPPLHKVKGVMENIRGFLLAELATSNPSNSIIRIRNHLHSPFHTPTHPPYALMILRAVGELNEGRGSSENSISGYIRREFEDLPLAHDGFLRHHLRKLCEKREVLCMDDGQYILWPVNGASKKGFVGRKWKWKKKMKWRRETERRTSRPNRVEDRCGEEEKEGGEIGEENQSMEWEIEGQTMVQEIRIEGIEEQKKGDAERKEVAGKVFEGKEEKTEVVEEQFEAERQQMEVTEVQIERKSIESNIEGGSDEEIIQEFIKEKHKASEILNKHIEAGEGQNEVSEQQLGMGCQQNEPRPQETQVIEKRLDKTKLSHKTISSSSLNKEQTDAGERQNEVLEEHQLGISSEQNEPQLQPIEVIEKQCQMDEVQKQQLQESCGQQDKIKLNHKTTSASPPTATYPPLDLSSHGQQVDLEEQPELPISQAFPKLKSARKKKLSFSQQQEQNQGQDQRRKLRSAAATKVWEPRMLSQHQDELEEKQHQQRPHKQKRDMKMGLEAELPLDFDHCQEEWSLKRRALGGTPKLISDSDAGIEVVAPSDVEGQLQQKLLRSRKKEPSFSESATPTRALSSMPSEHKDEQQQLQAQHQGLVKGRGRPPKAKADMDLNAGSPLSSASQHHQEGQPPKRRGRGRPPKVKPDADTSVEVLISPLDVQHQREQSQLPARGRGRGRPPKAKPDAKGNWHVMPQHSKLAQPQSRASPPKAIGISSEGCHLQRQGKPKSDSDCVLLDPQIEQQLQPKRQGRGRPPKPKSDTDIVMQDPLTPQIEQQLQPKRQGRGRPPKPKSDVRDDQLTPQTEPASTKASRSERPPNPKSDRDCVTEDPQIPETKLFQPKRGRGRPPKSH